MATMTSPAENRTELIRHLNDVAVVRGKVTLSSGQEADYYVDVRRVTLHGQAAPILGQVLLDVAEGWDFDAVGGLTLGADPVATSMLHASAARGSNLDAYVVRKEQKKHGMQRRIEGPSIEGRRVLVVEDTSTTGNSALTAAKAVEEAGATIVGVLVGVDRGTGAKEAVEAAGYEYRFAVSSSELTI